MGAGDRSAGPRRRGDVFMDPGTKHVLTRPRGHAVAVLREIAMEAAFGGAPQLATSAHIFHGVRAIRRIAPEFSRTLMDTWSPERRFGLEGR